MAISMAIHTAKGVFVVTDIKSVCYAKVGTPTIYFKNCDGREASVPFEEIVSFAMGDIDADNLSEAQPPQEG